MTVEMRRGGEKNKHALNKILEVILHPDMIYSLVISRNIFIIIFQI